VKTLQTVPTLASEDTKNAKKVSKARYLKEKRRSEKLDAASGAALEAANRQARESYREVKI
jgi:hypothetical protein